MSSIALDQYHSIMFRYYEMSKRVNAFFLFYTLEHVLKINPFGILKPSTFYAPINVNSSRSQVDPRTSDKDMFLSESPHCYEVSLSESPSKRSTYNIILPFLMSELCQKDMMLLVSPVWSDRPWTA